MLNEKQTDRLLDKLQRFEELLEPLLFDKVGEVDFKAFHTAEQLHEIPGEASFFSVEKGWKWGGKGTYCWFLADYTVPPELCGKTLFLRPHIGGREGFLWVNGRPFGIFNGGEHRHGMIALAPEAGETVRAAIEYYAGHYCPGVSPLRTDPDDPANYEYSYNGADICVKNAEIQDFYFDLQALNQLAEFLPENSFRRADVINCLFEVHKAVYYSLADAGVETFMDGLRAAAPLMKRALAVKSGESAPFAALTGHSHMDTAWLWHVGETVKKCARTYSNQISLMEQYPEYRFVQSSSCHSDFMREHYPTLFEDMRQKVAEGRYEPNGGVWVECDCNITSGEAMVRQFLWGQRFTREHFNYTSDCFWLPDTFGYSAAVPQIMKGCGVDYFLTTKISWNDTNEFPYDTFWWQGIDGTKVFSHFNTMHHHPDAESLIKRLDGLKQKTVTDMRCTAYGFGDGGGGPAFDMIEQSRRCADLDGVGRSAHMSVGDFMRKLEQAAVNPNTYKGELYLEIHRGTLTNQHTIKRNNRKAEFALRDLEYITVAEAVKAGAAATGEKIAPLYRTLLLNQFHDILPGTSIHRVHVECREQVGGVIEKARALTQAMIDESGDKDENTITLINTLSFDREDTQFIDCPEGWIVSGGYPQQRYVDLDGKQKLLVGGVKIPAFGSVTLRLVKGEPGGVSQFKVNGNTLETPRATVKFDERGRMESFTDRTANREVRGEGYPLNALILAEDVPKNWDNWDVDADMECKFRDCSRLISREVVSDGAAAYIVRSEVELTANTTVRQDMIFFADSAEVRFDTAIDWNDDHRFLKAAFDTAVFDDFARQEIQFGYLRRPTNRNTSVEQAKFEVSNHKYTDISESRYGAAVLNDCKYGISLNGGSMRLSLHKGGNRPDDQGDRDGVHRCVYSFLPHNSGFSAESVIQPAYMLNVPAIQARGEYNCPGLLNVDAPNVIVESVKPCEDGTTAFIARLYEAEGTYTNARVTLFDGAKAVDVTNMLEESVGGVDCLGAVELGFGAFEIKTLKISY